MIWTYRSWLNIGCWNWVVDVDHDTGLATGVRAGEGNERAGTAAAAVCDVDLSAREVELRAAEARGGVQRDVLDADDVLAGRERLRDGDWT